MMLMMNSHPVLPSNDTIETAQIIPNPTLLGGYVNRPGSGPSGRSRFSGDINDFYVADLEAGQTVNLFVANQNLVGNDLDLALRDQNGEVINSSAGVGATETLEVPRDGRYFIQVNAHFGASNYVLSIGQNFTGNSNKADTLQLSDEFVAGEVLVELNSNDADFTAQSTLTSLSQLGLYNHSQDDTRRMRMSFATNTVAAFSNNSQRITGFATPELEAKYLTLLRIKALRQRPDIASASPNYIIRAFRTPNDRYYNIQWHYPMLNLPQAWDVTTGDTATIVAVVDTGVLLRHPDLRNQLVAGYDFIANVNTEVDGTGGIDPNADDPGDSSAGGSTFHGSHVAGIIAATTNNGTGVAGISWATRIMPLRVLGRNGAGTDYDVEQAVRFAAGFTNDSGTVPAQRADIINLSLGGPDISTGLQSVVEAARNAGVFIVAAAGNDGSSRPSFPASLDGVISVSAVNIEKEQASYSNFGQFIDVAAPGGDNTPDINGDGIPDGIISTVGDDRGGSITFSYASSNGTSQAAPHVAGVIALMRAVNPNLTPQQFDDLLVGGSITEDLGSAGRDNDFGHGLIDAQAAVAAASQLISSPVNTPSAELVVLPQSLNFGLGTGALTVSLSNGGTGTLNINTIGDNSGGFLSIAPISVTTSGLGTYTVALNRGNLAAGTYTATITVVSSANTINIPVIWQVGDSALSGNAGHHYILLYDATSGTLVEQVDVSPLNGIYRFQFNDIPAGNYEIFAGSDFDNDGFICDVGEACGAYLTLARPTTVQITSANLNQLNFSTSYNVNFISQQSATSVPVDVTGLRREFEYRQVAR